MLLVLTLALAVSFFATIYYLIVPSGIYQTSPLDLTLDKINSQLKERLTTGNKALAISAMGKTQADIIKIALMIGLGLGFITFFIGFKFIGVLVIPLAIIVAIGGVLLTEKVLENEFKLWQARALESAPTLINFIPAFLEIGNVTLGDTIRMTLPFLREPLKSEVWRAYDQIARTGKVTPHDALMGMANKIQHPCIDAVCFRLSVAWTTRVKPDIFDDLTDQLDDMKEVAATRATTAKSGLLALICVFGLIGAFLVYGYAGWKWLTQLMTGGFGM